MIQAMCIVGWLHIVNNMQQNPGRWRVGVADHMPGFNSKAALSWKWAETEAAWVYEKQKHQETITAQILLLTSDFFL